VFISRHPAPEARLCLSSYGLQHQTLQWEDFKRTPGALYEVLGGGGTDSRGLSIAAHSLTAQRGELMFPAAYCLTGWPSPAPLSLSVHHVRRPLCWHSRIELKVRLPHGTHHDLANLGPQRSSPNCQRLRTSSRHSQKGHMLHTSQKCERRSASLARNIPQDSRRLNCRVSMLLYMLQE